MSNSTSAPDLSGSRASSNGLNILSLSRYSLQTMSNVNVYKEKEVGGRVTKIEP